MSANRTNYRRNNPKSKGALEASKGKLLSDGKEREVELPNGNFVFDEVYTQRETAEALGRTLLTVRKWVADKMIPPPVLKTVAGGYGVYTKEELQTIAKVLATHEQEFQYLHCTHHTTINRIWQAIQAVRSSRGY